MFRAFVTETLIPEPRILAGMNPIEQAWSKLKAHLRAKAARSREALERALPDALHSVTARNAQGWSAIADTGRTDPQSA